MNEIWKYPEFYPGEDVSLEMMRDWHFEFETIRVHTTDDFDSRPRSELSLIYNRTGIPIKIIEHLGGSSDRYRAQEVRWNEDALIPQWEDREDGYRSPDGVFDFRSWNGENNVYVGYCTEAWRDEINEGWRFEYKPPMTGGGDSGPSGPGTPVVIVINGGSTDLLFWEFNFLTLAYLQYSLLEIYATLNFYATATLTFNQSTLTYIAVTVTISNSTYTYTNTTINYSNTTVINHAGTLNLTGTVNFTGATVIGLSGTNYVAFHQTVTLAEIQSAGAGTMGASITLTSVPAHAVVFACKVKHAAQYSSPGMTGASCDIGMFGTGSLLNNASFALNTAPSSGNFGQLTSNAGTNDVPVYNASSAADIIFLFGFTSSLPETVADLSGGDIDIWVWYATPGT